MPISLCIFQELMNKVLHDQPDDPLVYLIRMLYRKAALPVPKVRKDFNSCIDQDNFMSIKL